MDNGPLITANLVNILFSNHSKPNEQFFNT